MSPIQASLFLKRPVTSEVSVARDDRIRSGGLTIRRRLWRHIPAPLTFSLYTFVEGGAKALAFERRIMMFPLPFNRTLYGLCASALLWCTRLSYESDCTRNQKHMNNAKSCECSKHAVVKCRSGFGGRNWCRRHSGSNWADWMSLRFFKPQCFGSA